MVSGDTQDSGFLSELAWVVRGLWDFWDHSLGCAGISGASRISLRVGLGSPGPLGNRSLFHRACAGQLHDS